MSPQRLLGIGKILGDPTTYVGIDFKDLRFFPRAHEDPRGGYEPYDRLVLKSLNELKAKHAQLEKDSQSQATNLEKMVLASDQEAKRANEAEAKLREALAMAEELAQKRVEEALAHAFNTLQYKMAAGVDAAIFLHSFVDSFQEETPIMVKHYKEFIQPYPQPWFEGLSFDPPAPADGDIYAHVPAEVKEKLLEILQVKM
ncbi:hypothetical protein LIER_02341 [Lithospermum erythrorhizon]|uniref:Uncharacterized protein n=1 Tax=Lithospermum erythrorhizon TaxID=34254 RepID=A0AAV3NRJ8_LITER